MKDSKKRTLWPTSSRRPVATCGGLYQPGILDRVDQRLGADHVLAGRERLGNMLAVEGVGRKDGHDVDVWTRQHLLVIGRVEKVRTVTARRFDLFGTQVTAGHRPRMDGTIQAHQQGAAFVQA